MIKHNTIYIMEAPILGLLNPKKMQLYIRESPPFFFGMEGPTRHQKTRVLRSVFQNGPCMKWSWVFHFIRDMGSSFHRASITRTERTRPPHPSSVTWIESSVSLAAKLHEHGVSVHVCPGSDIITCQGTCLRETQEPLTSTRYRRL